MALHRLTFEPLAVYSLYNSVSFGDKRLSDSLFYLCHIALAHMPGLMQNDRIASIGKFTFIFIIGVGELLFHLR